MMFSYPRSPRLEGILQQAPLCGTDCRLTERAGQGRVRFHFEVLRTIHERHIALANCVRIAPGFRGFTHSRAAQFNATLAGFRTGNAHKSQLTQEEHRRTKRLKTLAVAAIALAGSSPWSADTPTQAAWSILQNAVADKSAEKRTNVARAQGLITRDPRATAMEERR